MASKEDLTTLCRRLKSSDREAFEQVFRTLHDAIFRYVRSMIGGESAARDITQDVFIRLWDAREGLDPDRSLEAYVYRVARNRVYNHKRNHRTRANKRADIKDAVSPNESGPLLPDVQLQSDTLEANLERWIDDLPGRQKEALLLSRYEGLSHDEIASVMDISPRTVNNHIVAALKKIRNQIRAFEPSLLNS